MINYIKRLYNKVKNFLVELKNTQFIYPYIMLFTALTFLSSLIYVRFLRVRLPKDIPFQLTFTTFLILLFACSMYLYLIKIIVKPKIHSILPHNIIKVAQKIGQYLVMSLKLLDFNVKHNKLTEKYYRSLVKRFTSIVLEFEFKEQAIFAYSFLLFPGYLLASVLVIEVFLLDRIKIFYYFIFFGVLPLFYTYYIYWLSQIKEEYIQQLESKYQSVKIYDENFDYMVTFNQKNPNATYNEVEISIQEYFVIQLQHQKTKYPEYDPEDPETYEIIYIGSPFAYEEVYIQYHIKYNKVGEKLTETDYNEINGEFYMLEPKILKFMNLMELNKTIQDQVYFKVLHVLLYLLYFITWIYILVKSLHTLPENMLWIKHYLLKCYCYHTSFSHIKCYRLFTTGIIIITIQCIRIFYR